MSDDKNWTTVKPAEPGVYGVRGFNLCEPEQFEAVVQVLDYCGGVLVCNLHEGTSEDRLDRWPLLDDLDEGFEWCRYVPAPTAQGVGE